MTFVVNDDVEAALELHRRRRAPRPGRRGAPSARGAPGCCSAAPRRRSSRRSRPTRTTSASGRSGSRRRRTTPTRRSASTGCARSAKRSTVPVVAIGGIDALNAGDCIRAGAAGVAVDPRRGRPGAAGRPSMRLSEIGELGLLAELERRGLIVGVEHDAAQLAGDLVVTQDALVEGVHFRLDWLSWRDLGWRAAAVNLSDLAASGARPEALLVTLVAPAATRTSTDVRRALRGIAETGVPVVGGDTTQRPALVVSVTALGRSAARPRSRRGAARRRARRHRAARRRGRGVPRAALRAPAAAARRRARARRATRTR